MKRAVAISNSLARGSLLTAAWLCVVFWAISVMRLSREPVLTNKLVANIKCALWPRPRVASLHEPSFFSDRGHHHKVMCFNDLLAPDILLRK